MQEKKRGKLFGFRSGKLWKKIISVIYLAFFSIIILANLIAGRAGQLSVHDTLVNKMSVLFIFLIFLTPYIFLSDTVLRRKLPLFKSGKFLPSLLGLVAASVVLVILSSVAGSFHSDEYKSDMDNHAYELVATDEATCISEGVNYFKCSYCETESEETVPAQGHSPAEHSRTDATCTEDGKITYRCTLCGEETSETIAKTGHNIVETSHTDATCISEGETVSRCTYCGEETVETHPILPHTMAETNRVEATCTKDGKTVSTCSVCGFESVTALPAGHKMTTVSHRAATDFEDGETVTECSVCKKTFVEVLPCRYPLGCKENPYDFDLSELVTKLSKDSFIKEYEGKYVRFTGTVLHKNNSQYYFVSNSGKGLFCNLGTWDDIDYGRQADVSGMVTASEDGGATLKDCTADNIVWPEETARSPITITSWTYKKDSVGGVQWTFKYKNNSAKTIKYIDMEWVCYNAVDDLVYDEITGDISYSIRITGPLDPGKSSSCRTGGKFYSYSYAHSVMAYIRVEYMDGETVMITDERFGDIFA